MLGVILKVKFSGTFLGGGLFETIGTFEFISNKFTKSAENKRKKMKIKTASKIGIKFGR